jgi:hypothetical protein
MQTYRAYLNGPGGTLVWAAWIEATDLDAAQSRAAGLCSQGAPSVELWTPSATASAGDFEAV